VTEILARENRFITRHIDDFKEEPDPNATVKGGVGRRRGGEGGGGGAESN